MFKKYTGVITNNINSSSLELEQAGRSLIQIKNKEIIQRQFTEC